MIWLIALLVFLLVTCFILIIVLIKDRGIVSNYFDQFMKMKQRDGLFATLRYVCSFFWETIRSRYAFISKKYSNDNDLHRDSAFRVALAEGGGVGDAIMDTQFLKSISGMSDKPVYIDFYCRSNRLFSGYPFISNAYPYTEDIDKNKYDVIFIGHRFMIIYHSNDARVAAYSEALLDYCNDCRKLITTDMANILNDNLITQYALLKGKNRIEQSNINNILPFDRYTKKYMPLKESEFEILNQYNLRDSQYIVVNRAVDEKYGNKHPKLWSLDNYNELVRKLKLRYPFIKIVMLGDSDKFDPISLVDVNLLKRTNLEQCKVILKHSLLLIAGEGGLVHMKNFLYGQSVVLFGPTLPIIFGYEENVNLRGEGCPYTCEWVTDTWSEGCLLEYREPKCINSVLVEDVYNATCELINHKLREEKYRIHLCDDTFFEVIGQIIDRHKKNGCIACTIEQCDSEFLISLKDKIAQVDVYMEKRPPRERCYFINEYYGSPFNIPAADETYDIVFCEWDSNSSNQYYRIKELLRVTSCNGQCVLLIPSDAANQAIDVFYQLGMKIDGSDINKSKDNVFCITKETKLI